MSDEVGASSAGVFIGMRSRRLIVHSGSREPSRPMRITIRSRCGDSAGDSVFMTDRAQQRRMACHRLDTRSSSSTDFRSVRRRRRSLDG